MKVENVLSCSRAVVLAHLNAVCRKRLLDGYRSTPKRCEQRRVQDAWRFKKIGYMMLGNHENMTPIARLLVKGNLNENMLVFVNGQLWLG